MDKKEFIKLLKKIWHFIWVEDSAASWIVNIILAFVLIKFIIYPGMGLVFGTNFPIVAVVSCSMEHNQNLGSCSIQHNNFDSWFDYQSQYYYEKNITKEEFSGFSFRNGFNKGDLMVLFGVSPEKIKKGDVKVYKAGRPDPIIHRVIQEDFSNGIFIFQTKGDNNVNQIKSPWLDETNVQQSQIVGKAVLRIPYLGWVKIIFVEMLKLIGVLK